MARTILGQPHRNARAAFAHTMRKRRESMGLTQMALAALLGCTTRSIINYENGYTWPSYERRKALGVILRRRDLQNLR